VGEKVVFGMPCTGLHVYLYVLSRILVTNKTGFGLDDRIY
jgi:hypothetical protein